MERSLAARLSRPFLAPAPHPRAARGNRPVPGHWWRPFALLGGLARACWLLISRHRRLRTVLLVVLLTLPLLAGGWLLLRSSPLTSVEQVRVSGLHGPQARSIETALTGAASHMSTLGVHTAALRAAVASFPVVRSVRAIPSFPHGLRIVVSEQPPAAALVAGGTRTAVAADGVVLGPALLSGSLPTLNGAFEPSVGQHLHDATLLGSLALLGAAPVRLAKHVARVYSGPEGLTVAMRNGLLVYFGDSARPHAKWLSLAGVLADSSSRGASYIDVRLPERPAAGFPSGSGPSNGAASTTGQTSTSESTVTALAAGLSATTGSGTTTAAGEPASSSEASSAPAASEATSSSLPTESTSTSESETPASSPSPGG